jgi:uncharacterized phage protein (TIGR02220 family)
MAEPKKTIKIWVSELENAEDFFGNDADYFEFCGWITRFFRGINTEVYRKNVKTYLKAKKNHFQYILDSSKYGAEGFNQRIENQIDKDDTLNTPLDTPLSRPLDTKERKGKESKVKESKETIHASVMTVFNSITGKECILTKSRESQINARLKDGYTLQDFEKVIASKKTEWVNTEWEKYISPDTLFGTKFTKYLENAKPLLGGDVSKKEPNPNHYANEDTYLYACKKAGVTPKDYYNAN